MHNSVFGWGHKLDELDGNEVLAQNILYDEYLHSSYDYPNQFNQIRTTSKNYKKKINLISKIYLDIPFYNMIAVGARPPCTNGLNRYGSLLYQTERIFNYFENEINDFVLQICSIPKDINFSTKDISNFLKIVNSKFGVNKIFIETFPDAESSTIKLILILKEEAQRLKLSNNLRFGFAGYENVNSYGFSENIKSFIEKNDLMIMPIKIFSGKNEKKNERFIEDSINYIENLSKYKYFFKAITSTSNLLNYKFLKSQNNKINFNSSLRNRKKLLIEYSGKKKFNGTPYRINYNKVDLILILKRYLLLFKAIILYPNFLNYLKRCGF